MHIGKTGGSALKAALRPVAEEYGLVWLSHSTRLHDIPETETVVFFVRDPMTRFVSAFNSRLRRGAPRLHSPWNDDEALAFRRFREPNELAEALSSGDATRRAAAESAMRGIRHVNMPLTSLLGAPADVERRRPSIAFVGFQRQLAADFESLKERLGLPPHLALPSDPVEAHVSPPELPHELSDTGRRNLGAWYAGDVELYAFLETFRREMDATA